MLSLGAGGDVELHRFTFAEGLETLAQDRREMDEHVLPVLRGHEAIALLVAEPLDCTFSHAKLDNLPFFYVSYVGDRVNKNDCRLSKSCGSRMKPCLGSRYNRFKLTRVTGLFIPCFHRPVKGYSGRSPGRAG